MVILKSKIEINKYIAENLYGINFKELKPHDWERGYFIKCRRCGEMKKIGFDNSRDFDDFLESYGKGKTLYAWNIENLKIYDKLKELSDFELKRAPQSWCYVEVVK